MDQVVPAHGAASRRYPEAPAGDAATDYHGERVADPYRALEDPAGPATAAFLAAQQALAESFLAGAGGRDAIADRLAALAAARRAGVPARRGDRWFQVREDGPGGREVLYVLDAPGQFGRSLLDPAPPAAGGSLAVVSADVSPDGLWLAYAIAAPGGAGLSWRVRDTATATDTADRVDGAGGAVAWRADGTGFYYAAAESAEPGEASRGRTLGIAFHRIGTLQAQDPVLLDNSATPDRLLAVATSAGGGYLIVRAQHGLDPRTDLMVLDLRHPGARFEPLIAASAARVDVAGNVGPVFYLVTDDGADRGRIIAVDLDYRDRADWREIVPEAAETLLEARLLGGMLVCHYLRDAASVLRVHGLDGLPVRDIALPGAAGPVTLGGSPLRHEAIDGAPDEDIVYFETVSFTESGTLWVHDLGTGQTRQARPPSVRLDPEEYAVEQVRVASGDGTAVPMFLVRRCDVRPDGQVPVLACGYGGAGVPASPAFSLPWAVWLEHGGLLAVACLRGGGEFGRAWREAGRRDGKQHAFDDFCACLRWLADSGWSRPGRIAISGIRGGGLLAGACLTQHPELFGAAVATDGMFDMLRYPRLGDGWMWTGEFGSPAAAREYAWLRAYSPLHHVRPGTRYPAALLLTGDPGSRVSPAHSLKFAAALQAAQAGDAPVLLRPGGTAGRDPAAAADWLAFLDRVLAG